MSTLLADRGQCKGHPATADVIYTDREWEFLQAMEEYKRTSGRKFPTWAEALRVAEGLGYRKVASRAQPSNGNERGERR